MSGIIARMVPCARFAKTERIDEYSPINWRLHWFPSVYAALLQLCTAGVRESIIGIMISIRYEHNLHSRRKVNRKLPTKQKEFNDCPCNFFFINLFINYSRSWSFYSLLFLFSVLFDWEFLMIIYKIVHWFS